jgi:hypothetical protein
MSDTATILDTGAPAPAAIPAAAAPPGSPPVAADPAPAAAASPPAAADPAPAADAGTDWRKTLAGEDEKILKSLERFAAPTDFYKAFADTQTALRNKTDGMIKVPGADATDDDRAAFAKALGIPEAPDKYEIKVKPPEGLEIGDADKAFLSRVTEKLHSTGGFAATPEVANLAHELYFEAMQEQAAQMAAAAVQKKQAGQALLQKTYGSNLALEMQHAESALAAFGPRDNPRAFLDRQFADGTRVGDDPEMIQLLIRASRATQEDPMLLRTLSGALPNDVSTVQQRIDEIMKLKGTPAYDQRADELRTLFAQRERISGRG